MSLGLKEIREFSEKVRRGEESSWWQTYDEASSTWSMPIRRKADADDYAARTAAVTNRRQHIIHVLVVSTVEPPEEG